MAAAVQFSREKKQLIRKQLWNIMRYGKGRMGRLFSYGLLALILFSVVILPLEFLEFNSQARSTLQIIEVVLTTLFTVEYLLRIYAAPKRLTYILSFMGIIDLLSILPFYLGFVDTQFLRAFRIVRLLRLLKLARIESAAVAGKETAKELDLLPGEKVTYVVAKHPMVLISNTLISIICFSGGLVILMFSPIINSIVLSIVGSIFLFALIYFYKILLDYNYDVIYVSTHRLIFQNWHLVGRNTNQVSYRSITNVKPHYTGILSFFLRYGSISIETPSVAAGKIEYNYLRRHEEAAQAIMEKCFMDSHQPETVVQQAQAVSQQQEQAAQPQASMQPEEVVIQQPSQPVYQSPQSPSAPQYANMHPPVHHTPPAQTQSAVHPPHAYHQPPQPQNIPHPPQHSLHSHPTPTTQTSHYQDPSVTQQAQPPVQ